MSDDRMKRAAFVFAALLPAVALAQAPRPEPSTAPPEPNAIPLPTQAKASSSTEQWFRFGGREYGVRNVSDPL
jgi:hypothetical protein